MSLHRMQGKTNSEAGNLLLKLQLVLELIEKEQKQLAKMRDDLALSRSRSTGTGTHLKSLTPRSVMRGTSPSGLTNRPKVHAKSDQPGFYVSNKLEQAEIRRLTHVCEQQAVLISSLEKRAVSIRDEISRSLKRSSRKI